MANVDVFKTEKALFTLIMELLAEANRLGSDDHYTKEGKAERWQRFIESDNRLERIEGLRADVATAQRGAERAGGWARTEALGERLEDTDVATELKLARLLDRHEDWTTDKLLKTVEPILGTPLCAELVAELNARGQVEWETFGPLVARARPELVKFHDAVPRVQAAVDQLQALIEQLDQVLNVATVYGVVDGKAKYPQSRYSAVSDYVGGGKLVIFDDGQFQVNYDDINNVSDVIANRHG